ncbi:S-layer homology domain-containing protein [Paenibacillus sp. YN15]|uniref:S-layer homology domain-containing protein n=1 Tax=Paenibacillus sp. YN15 TaxID=1742774 RepID=UPI000DCCC800|nr:S-layer homology domain-containing protein [Paenibacillus sp. YN15]RAU91282.1 hypothetical protein DQG13_29630 [Paenibacillus sp. YN15]
MKKSIAKIVVIIIAAAFIWTSTSMTGISSVSAETNHQGNQAAPSLLAEVNSDTNEVRIHGYIASNEGKWLTVVVTNPNQSIDYIDQIRSGQGGSYLFSYRIGNAVEGTYTVHIYDVESDRLLTGTFVYQPSDNGSSPSPSPTPTPTPTPAPEEPASEGPAPKPAGVGDMQQKVKTIAADIEKSNITAKEALDRALEAIKNAAGLNDSEKSQLRDDLAALAQIVLRKAGSVDQDAMDRTTRDHTLAARLSKAVVLEKITLLNEAVDELSKSLKKSGFDHAAGIGIGRKELTVAFHDNENRNVSVGLLAESLNQLAANDIYLSIENREVAFTVPPGALTDPEMNEMAAGSSIEISAAELDEAETAEYAGILRSSAAADNSLILKGKIFDLNVEAIEGSTRKKLESFKGKISVELSYTGAPVHEDKLGVYRYNPESGAWDYAGGKADRETKKVVFGTGHFSLYAVMEYIRSFEDIKDHHAREDIEILASKHILFGVDSHKFEPDRTITRAEIAAILVRALGLDALPYNHTFSDVEPDAWYADIVGTVAEAGLFEGDAGKFRPNDRITEEEMAVLAMRAYYRAGGKAPEAGGQERLLITDDVSLWAVGAVTSALRLGLIEEGIQPGNHPSRAWSAVVMRKLLDLVG